MSTTTKISTSPGAQAARRIANALRDRGMRLINGYSNETSVIHVWAGPHPLSPVLTQHFIQRGKIVGTEVYARLTTDPTVEGVIKALDSQTEPPDHAVATLRNAIEDRRACAGEGGAMTTYAERVRQLEDEGLPTTDAQAVADAEASQGRVFTFDPSNPNDPGDDE